jgi:hypothetical protein
MGVRFVKCRNDPPGVDCKTEPRLVQTMVF